MRRCLLAAVGALWRGCSGGGSSDLDVAVVTRLPDGTGTVAARGLGTAGGRGIDCLASYALTGTRAP
ncbi:MAG TPA: hypothetical protein VGQ83_39720 [Polyangia bacterium]|jgi:hypothetical protein